MVNSAHFSDSSPIDIICLSQAERPSFFCFLLHKGAKFYFEHLPADKLEIRNVGHVK